MISIVLALVLRWVALGTLYETKTVHVDSRTCLEVCSGSYQERIDVFEQHRGTYELFVAALLAMSFGTFVVLTLRKEGHESR